MLGRYLKQFAQSPLLRVTSINGIGVVVQIISGLIASKVIAVFLGERGVALMGYLRNFLTSVQAGATLGFSNGIVKYVSQYEGEKMDLRELISTSFYITVLSSFVIGLFIFFGADYWSALIFKESSEYVFVFKYLAFALPFYAVNVFLVSVINGYSKYKKVVKINIATSIIGLVMTVVFIWQFEVKGALLAMTLSPALAICATLIFGMKNLPLRGYLNISSISYAKAKPLFSYTGMAVFSSLFLPVAYIGVRSEIQEVDGFNGAGYWDAMTRIADYYFKFVSTLMVLYILPQLSKAKTAIDFRKEIFSFYKVVLPLFAVGLLLIFFLRFIIIRILFTEDFLPMEALFKWQLLGDLFKVASLVVGYQIIAKNLFKLFIITEVISIAVIYLSSIYFIEHFGFVGASMGHALSYFVHLVMLLFIFRKALFGTIKT